MKKILGKLLLLLITAMLIGGIYYFNEDARSFMMDTFYDLKVIVSGTKEIITDASHSLYQMVYEGDMISDDEAESLQAGDLTGEELSFDEEFCPYYGMLNDSQKAFYKQLYANITAMETEVVPYMDITDEDAVDVVMAVFNDHPELFWLDTSFTYSYTQDHMCAEIVLSFNSLSEHIDEYQKKFEEAAEEIIAAAQNLSDDYAKEKYVHDAVIDLVEYDLESSFSQSAFSALVNHRTVCAGYAKAFQYIMTKLQIPTYYVTGTAEEDHAWNIVKLDGEYYNVDLTWDDCEEGRYDFFNVTDRIFELTHTRTGLSENLPKCNGEKYAGKGASQAPEHFRREAQQSQPSVPQQHQATEKERQENAPEQPQENKMPQPQQGH